MPKFKSFISILLLISVLLSGCSAIGVKTKEKENIKVKVLTYSAKDFDNLKKHLAETFPHIEIEVVSVQNILNANNPSPEKRVEEYNKIMNEEKVDFYFYSIPEYNEEKDLVVDLNNLVTRDQVQFNEIQQEMIKANVLLNGNGALRTLSPSFDRKVVVVNRGLFQQNNIPEPANPMTLNELRESASQLKEADSSLIGYDVQHYKWYNTLQNIGENIQGLSLTNDNNKLLLDQPEWRELAQQLLDDYKQDILKNDYIVSSRREPSRTGINFLNASEIPFHITVAGSGTTAASLSILNLPVNEANPVSNPYYATAPLSINSESKYIDEIWEVIKYLMTEGAAEEIAKGMFTQGFVTYPQFITLGLGGGNLTADAFIGNVGESTVKTNSILTEEARNTVINELEIHFKSFIVDDTPFDIVWDKITSMVLDINNDPNSFVAT